MIKKTVTYEDPFTPGQEISEDLYFNLTKAELVEMEMAIGPDSSLKDHLENIAQAQNGQQIMDEMKGIILKAYGQRTPNGKFVKNEQLREEFASSEAYSTFFMDLVTDADAAVNFVKGIMPRDMVDEAQTQLAVDRPNLTEVSKPEPRVLSRREVLEMPGDELRSGLADGRYILGDDAAKV